MDLPITTAASSPRPTPSPAINATISASPARGAVFSPLAEAMSPFSLASASSLPPAIIERRPSLSLSTPPLAPSKHQPTHRANASPSSSASSPSLPPASPSASDKPALSAATTNGHAAVSLSVERPLYEPKNILVTGGAGFMSATLHTPYHQSGSPCTESATPVAQSPLCYVTSLLWIDSGSNVIIYLLTKYPHYRVVCLDKLEYCATINNFAEIKDHPNFTFIKASRGDICSLDLVNLILSSCRIDTILHFAAQTHVDNSFGLALDFTRTNIFGTHVLLEAIKHIHPQIRRFIHVSTDEVYGSSLLTSPTRLTEDSQLNPSNPYAATKVAAEYLVRSYAHSFGLPSIITRGNNVYGPKQYPEKLIPKFIYLLERGQPCPLHGDGQNRRSYLYVDDVSRAFDVILHRGEVGMIYNVGSDVEISNLGVFRTLLRAFGVGKDRAAADGGGGAVEGEERYVQFVRDRPYNDLRYFIDTSSLQQLGWRKEVSWEEGIARTMQWYMHNKQHWGDIGEGALAAHPRVEIKVAAEKE